MGNLVGFAIRLWGPFCGVRFALTLDPEKTTLVNPFDGEVLHQPLDGKGHRLPPFKNTLQNVGREKRSSHHPGYVAFRYTLRSGNTLEHFFFASRLDSKET